MASKITRDDVDHRFGFHKATTEGDDATLPRHRDTRILFRRFAKDLLEVIGQDQPREIATMLTKLQEASMWAHAAIAMDAPAVEE